LVFSASFLEHTGLLGMQELPATFESPPTDTVEVTSPDVDEVDKVHPGLAETLSPMLEEFDSLFNDLDAEGSNITAMPIKLIPDKLPKVIPPRRMSPASANILRNLVTEQLDRGIIEPSLSSFSAPTVLIPKPDGTFRLTVDYRELNACLIPIQHPLPNNQQLLSDLTGSKFFAKMDLKDGFFNVKIAEEDRPKTAFATPNGLYQYTRIPQGLRISPQYFQAQMTRLLQGIPGVNVFIDDIVVHSKTLSEYLSSLRRVFTILKDANIKLKKSKCSFDRQAISYLGFIVNGEGIRLSPARIAAIQGVNIPTTTKALHSFLGLANFFRHLLPNFAQMTAGLYAKLPNPTGRKNCPLSLSSDEQRLFLDLKQALAASTILYHIDYSLPLILRPDASMQGFGAVLLNGNPGEEKPVYFLSKKLTDAQTRWSTIELECFAIVWSIKSLSMFLMGHPFVVECDHRNLSYIQSSQTPKVVRWGLDLQAYDFVIRHISGNSNVVADHLSRFFMRKGDASSFTSTSDNLAPIPQEVLWAFSQTHNSRVGHHGTEGTVEKLKEAFPNLNHAIIPNFLKQISNLIQQCPTCQKLSQVVPANTSPHYSTKTFDPFVLISMDHIVGLPCDDEGNTAILVLTDHFSRFTFLYPTRSTDASQVARSLLQVYGFVGTPTFLSSDNGTAFTANVIKEFSLLLGINQKFTTEYVHEQNGMIERRNKEVLRHLRALVLDRQILPTWSLFLPLVQNILNNTKHSDTGFSPNELIFGFTCRRPISLMSSTTLPALVNFTQRYRDLMQAHSKMIAQAATNMSVLATNVIPQQFPIDSWVLVSRRRTQQFVNELTKLAPEWLGPYKVVAYDPATGVYSVEDFTNSTTNKNILPYHVSVLKQYEVAISNPVAIAAGDRNELLITKISQHSGSIKRKTGMKFLVHFADHSEEWLPYNNVKNTEALASYAKSAGIPL
jgi:hypothetical protein